MRERHRERRPRALPDGPIHKYIISILDRIPFYIVILVTVMKTLEEGSRVRIDIPDETDADHELHGEHGRVVEVIHDDASDITGDQLDSAIYRIKLDNGFRADFRHHDLRPPIE